MNIIEKVNGVNINDVITRPEAYPEEVIGAAVDVIVEMSRQIREAEVRLKGHIIEKMKHDNATKLMFVSNDGGNKMITLKSGSMQCENKDADMVYKKHGFDPMEIGEYVFKPSWSKAKEARKFGGDKQLVIDELFKNGKQSITISEA